MNLHFLKQCGFSIVFMGKLSTSTSLPQLIDIILTMLVIYTYLMCAKINSKKTLSFIVKQLSYVTGIICVKINKDKYLEVLMSSCS